MNRSMTWDIIIPQSEGPKRLENFLKKHFPIGYIRKLFRKNGVRLNGKRCGPDETARPGDRVALFIPFEERPNTGKKQRLLRAAFGVLFEDDDILLINKHAGIAVHEGKEILKSRSILGMLEATYRSRGIVPKLVHRIDKETSGLLVVAKSDSAVEDLEDKFETGEVEKEYLTLVIGRLYPKQGGIDFPLPGRAGRPVPALTHYKVERELPATSLVRVKIETGRMHQIRLHFAQLGHPVVMDDEHGDFAFNKRFRKRYGLKRQFLHASSVAFELRGKKRKWTAPLADDLTQTLRSLGEDV